MKITEIRIHLMGEERLKAFATVTFDDAFVVRNMKIVAGTKGIFVCMPSRKLPDGTHKDMVHPISQDFRKYLEENVLKAYEEELKNPSAENIGRSEYANSKVADGGNL